MPPPRKIRGASGIYLQVGLVARDVRRPVALESVRCLECGEVYAKPVVGGIVQTNPGCPGCAYVGWMPVTEPARARRRSGADRPRLRLVPGH